MTRMRVDYEGNVDVVAWTERTLTRALAFAEADLAATAAARSYHLERAVERGTCAVGHDLSLPEIPVNSLGTHPCGYCANARALTEP